LSFPFASPKSALLLPDSITTAKNGGFYLLEKKIEILGDKR
jgi:hypothetical protein